MTTMKSAIEKILPAYQQWFCPLSTERYSIIVILRLHVLDY